MDQRGFFPGFGFNPFFFPRRRFFPFFFLSPFFFPFFFRAEGDQSGAYHTQHHCKNGETMGALAQRYNCPQMILEAMNPHIQNPQALAAGTTVNIPRLDKMYCHKMYLEQEVPETGAGMQAPMTQGAMAPAAPSHPGMGMPYPMMYPGQ